MSREQWLRYANANKDKLRQFILRWHPALGAVPDPSIPITAPTAELAMQRARAEIAEEFIGDPVAQFDAALEAGDRETVRAILDDAWFGVPESTDAWQIPGFSECIKLMEG